MLWLIPGRLIPEPDLQTGQARHLPHLEITPMIGVGAVREWLPAVLTQPCLVHVQGLGQHEVQLAEPAEFAAPVQDGGRPPANLRYPQPVYVLSVVREGEDLSEKVYVLSVSRDGEDLSEKGALTPWSMFA